MTNDEQLSKFYSIINNQYVEFGKKMKQFCFLNHIDYDEDTLQDTVLKVCEKIKKKGIKDTSEQGMMNYLFTSFKFNTYQSHLQNQKKKIDDNINLNDLEIIYNPYKKENEEISTIKCNYIKEQVQQYFDLISYSVWRLRYFSRIDGKEPNYKKIKEITKVNDVRRRIVMINKWIRTNIKEDDINNYINNVYNI